MGGIGLILVIIIVVIAVLVFGLFVASRRRARATQVGPGHASRPEEGARLHEMAPNPEQQERERVRMPESARPGATGDADDADARDES